MTEPIDKRAAILRWIEEQEAICEKATPGPWREQDNGIDGWNVVGPDGPIVALRWSGGLGFDNPDEPSDRAFVAASRSVLPLALAALRREVEAHAPFGRDGGYYRCRACDGIYESRRPCAGLERIFASLGLDPLQEGR